MADARLWMKLDVSYLRNHKMEEVMFTSLPAVLMHLASLLDSKMDCTDGYVSERVVTRHVPGATSEDADLLVEAGLWHRSGHDCERCPDDIPDGKVYVHDYLEHNPAKAEIARKSAVRSKAARARWDAEKPMQNALQVAVQSAEQDASHPVMQSAMQRERESRESKRLPQLGLTPSPRRPKAAESDPAFEDFWKAYPRRIGKQEARKAFAKATKSAEPERIIAAVESYSASVQGKDPQYVAHPSTWLNQGRWEDEPDRTPEPQRPWAYQPLPEVTPEQEAANQAWLLQRKAEELAVRGEGPEEYFEAEQLPGFDWQGAK